MPSHTTGNGKDDPQQLDEVADADAADSEAADDAAPRLMAAIAVAIPACN